MSLETVLSGVDFPYRELYTMIHSFTYDGKLYYATTYYIRKYCKAIRKYSEANYKEPIRGGDRESLEALEKYCRKMKGKYLSDNDFIEFLLNELNPKRLKDILEFSLKLKNMRSGFYKLHGFPLDNLLNLVGDEEAMSFFRSFLSFCYEYGELVRCGEKELFEMSEDDGFKNIESRILNDPLYKYLNNLLNSVLREKYVVPVYVWYAPELYSIPEEEMQNAIRLGVWHGINIAVKPLDKKSFKSFVKFLKTFGIQAYVVIPEFAKFVGYTLRDFGGNQLKLLDLQSKILEGIY